MPEVRNHTFDELTIGQRAESTRTVTMEDIRLFAAASGDHNPLHLDPAYAAGTAFGECIAHGMFSGGLISAALAMQLPGPGTIYLGQSLAFRLPVKIGDTLTVQLTVTDKQPRRRQVTLDCLVLNQHGKKVVTGSAEVIAPAERETVTIAATAQPG
ncbi:MAG: MaoC/PaaZ C-terminal domain-containing protein [Haliea sp.]|uniref:MaoC/PaaZ C-terminal domain-containing protein n=1 Tax=Haliea sp. TaxID=1932666 RepID=UPI0032EC6109